MILGRLKLAGPTAVAAVLLACAPTASADRNFGVRYSTQAPGNITMAANTLMTCDPAQSGCAAAANDTSIGTKPNSSLNNNSWTMVNINASGNPALANASKARLVLPAGAQVLWAGLYWVANAPSGLTAARAKAVKMQGPDGALKDITASVYDPAPNAAVGYACFADVTATVMAQGAGTYMVGDVATRPNTSNVGAGWSLVVAYQAPGEPLRDLSIFDGQRTVSGTDMITIPISGFRTPATGQVKSDVGIVAFEGDRGVTGDYAQLDNTVLSDALTPELNFFNAWIEMKGVPSPGRVPAQGNAFGFDSKIVAANGVLANNATSAVIRAKTNGESYQPIVATFATELYAPKIDVTKSVSDVNGGYVRVGDELLYTLHVANNGGDGALAADLLENSMPAGTEYVAGSMTYDGSPISDSGSDDRGESAGGTGPLGVRIGTVTSTTIGGRIAPGESHTFTFKVKITSVPPGGGLISNVAVVDYTAETLGSAVVAQSPRADIRVLVPDAAIVKTITSSHFANNLPATYRLSVSNEGGAPTSGTTTVTDDLPVPFRNSPTITGTGWTCDPIVGGHVSCSRSDALAPGLAYPPITISVAKLDNPSGTVVTNTAHVTTPLDENPTNDQSTAERTVGAGSSLIPVLVSAQQGYVYPGQTVGVTGFFTNNGPSVATNPLLVLESAETVSDVPATGFTVTSSDGSVTKADCHAEVTPAGKYKVICDPSTLKDGVTVEITINFRPAPGTALTSFDVNGTSSADNWAGGPGTSSDTVLIAPTADLSVTKAVDTATASPGDTLTYTVTVANNGPRSTLNEVNVTDELPSDLTVQTATWTAPRGSGTCDGGSGNLVRCQFGTPSSVGLNPGESATVTITALVGAGASGPVLNCANATNIVRDPNPGDEQDCVEVTVLPWAELNLEKQGPVSLKPGGTGAYSLSLTNNGPSDAAGVKVVDTLPVGLTPVSPLPAGCTAAGRKVTCTVGSLANGASQSLSLSVKAASSLKPGTKLKNIATATSDTPGPSAEASDVTPIVVASSSTAHAIGTEIVAPSRPQALGSVFKLWVKVSAGKARVRGASVCGTLPANVAYLSSRGAHRGSRVCWYAGTLNARAAKWYSIDVLAIASGTRTATSAARGIGTGRVTDSTAVRVYGGFTG